MTDRRVFEPMSLREENWAESEVKNALRAEASRSSHAVVQAFTVTGNDFSAGDGISPTIRAGSDRQNTTPMVVVPVQDGRGMEKAQNGLGVGEPGDPMYTLDTTGAQAVAYAVTGERIVYLAPDIVNSLSASDLAKGQMSQQTMDSNLLQVYTVHGEHSTAMTGNGTAAVAFATDVTRCLDSTGGYATNQGGTLVVSGLTLPCNIDGAQIAPTLRGFGHGWQGQHNSTNAVAVYEYDGYNQKLDDSGVHRTLRIGRDSSDFVAYRKDTVPTLVSEEPTTTLTASDGGSSHLQRDLVQEDENVSTSNITPSQPIAFSHYSSDPSPSSIVPTLRAGTNVCGHAVAYREDTVPTLVSRELVGTLTADMGQKMMVNNQSVDNGHLQVFRGGDMTEAANNLVVRRLTPLECELLMGWDPLWTAEGVDENGNTVAMADTHRYRMCGNGVVANVAHWIAERYLVAREAAQR